MTFAVPRTVAGELFAQLEHLFNSNDVPDQFTVARLTREAAALQMVDAAEASMVKAGIAALGWKFEDAQRWLENSLRLDGSIANKLNAALTYRQLNRLDLTAQLGVECYQMAPKDPTVVNAVLESLCTSGQLTRALEIYRQAQRDGIKIEDGILTPVHIVEHIAELDIHPDRVEFEVRSAEQVLAQNRKRVLTFEYEKYEDHDEASSLVIRIGFEGDIADELRMESELAQVLAQEPGWNPCLLSTELQHLMHHANKPI